MSGLDTSRIASNKKRLTETARRGPGVGNSPLTQMLTGADEVGSV